MLDELGIQALSRELDSKEKRIADSLLGYKRKTAKFSHFNPFNSDPSEIREELVSDPSCLDTFSTLILPLEYDNWNKSQIVLDNPPGGTSGERFAWTNHVFKKRSVAAVDASYIRHDVHSNIQYAYMQVAVFWKDVGRYLGKVCGNLRIGDELYSSDRDMRLFEDEDYQEWNWELTIDLLRRHLVDCTPFFLFLDESLSISYAHNYTRDRQKRLLTFLLRYLEQVDEMGILPVAVYHSLDRGLINTGLKCLACDRNIQCKNCIDKPTDNEVSFKTLYDRLFLQDILVKNYSRTPCFRPLNSIIAKACDDLILDLAAFYLRVDDHILRIEFPFKYIREDKEVVQKIHEAVVADSLLSGGYPMTLMNAHELAVLTSHNRETVNEMVYRKTLEMTMKYGLNLSMKQTKKSELKRRMIT
ncbi:MAG: DNA double-strand break repair nuclease NurA [Nitrososphaeria archaeon]